jgi:sulfopyruvate decarboxylase subunit alpha
MIRETADRPISPEKESRVNHTTEITTTQKESVPGVPGASAAKTLAAIKTLGFTHVLMIPDSESRLLYQAIGEDPALHLITPCREGESIAIAAGLWTGGRKPLIVIQITGVMEAGDALRGCGLGPKVPLRLMVGWRGYGGAKAGRMPIDSAYTYTEPLLDAWGIPHWPIMGDEDLPMLGLMDRTAAERSSPAAVVTGYAFRP